jgi:cell division septation protein DedD
MSNKEYRELQLSSSLLIFIFLVVIILGVVIFILGVSVGKKQAQLSQTGQIPPGEAIEKVEIEKPRPIQEVTDPISEEIASHQQAQSTPEKPIPPSTTTKNLFYIQIGAFRDKSAANSLAGKYQNRGYTCVVFDPFPTDKRKIYRVRIGGYETRGQAEQEKVKLAQAENKKSSDYFIVKY